MSLAEVPQWELSFSLTASTVIWSNRHQPGWDLNSDLNPWQITTDQESLDSYDDGQSVEHGGEPAELHMLWGHTVPVLQD